ncbi:MAG: PilZ domain-containing protein [Bacteriovoracaceae bacterium]|nr:PilZ domain-containing protein [Bacteriovoracaceae bacterium]
MATFKRRYLRAPIYRWALFQDEEHVFKGRALNISEGGILLGELGHIPDINSLPMILDLPVFPEFNKINFLNFNFVPIILESTIIRVRGKIVRSFKGRSSVDMLFQNVGCEFVRLSDDSCSKIDAYVKRYTRNLIYILSLFESMGKTRNNPKIIRYLANILGYDSEVKLPILRMKMIHDYQSLESL